jgi:hypothetical protein
MKKHNVFNLVLIGLTISSPFIVIELGAPPAGCVGYLIYFVQPIVQLVVHSIAALISRKSELASWVVSAISVAGLIYFYISSLI